MAYNGIKVCHIVATDLNGCIGKDGKMPWHISEDLKRFKLLTEGGVVIMGRKTFESLGCKPLPNRNNVVITSQDKYQAQCDDNTTMFVDSIERALSISEFLAQFKSNPCIWVIGGAQIYEQTMQYVDVIEHTVIDMEVEGGDAFYPDIREDFDAIDAVELDGVYYYTLHRR